MKILKWHVSLVISRIPIKEIFYEGSAIGVVPIGFHIHRNPRRRPRLLVGAQPEPKERLIIDGEPAG